MQIQKLLQSDENRAVSPVIGVILMVAITVILAAVIGTFVLGLGDQVSETAPNAQFSFDYDGSALTIAHDGGDSIPANNVAITGGGTAGTGLTGTDPIRFDTTTISAGTTGTLDGVGSGDTIRVVWNSQDGSSSSTVGRWSGPDA